MIIIVILVMTIVPTPDRIPLLDLYFKATDCVQESSHEESAAIFNEIFTRMPDNPRAIYNHAVSSYANGDFFTADSLLSIFPEDVLQEDTLLEARSSARLGNAMANEDYAGVQSVLEMLLPELSTGESSQRFRHNYEVALKWLMQNEPPPPEDQEEPEDNEDQEEPEDNENQEEPEDDEDQEEPEDNEDQEENQPQPPQESEMTPEVAQIILDMVEEAEADITDGSANGSIGVPNW